MEKYKCGICGKTHNVFRVMESPWPVLLTEIPEEEKESRVLESNGFYVVDKKWFLRSGYIHIDLENWDGPFFYWNVWATISPDEFKTNLEKLKKEEPIELKGILQSVLPFYPESKGLESKVTIRATSDEILFDIRITEDSGIKNDQSKPITLERAIELMQHLHHPELFKDRKIFDKGFSDRLMEELNYAEKEYLKKEKYFAINVSSPNSVLFQIVSSKMLESSTVGKSGFGLHLSFCESLEESTEEIQKFLTQDYAKEFRYYYLDDIPTYQIDLGNNKDRVQELVERLVEDIYGHELEIIDMDNFEIPMEDGRE